MERFQGENNWETDAGVFHFKFKKTLLKKNFRELSKPSFNITVCFIPEVGSF